MSKINAIIISKEKEKLILLLKVWKNPSLNLTTVY